MSRAKTVGQRAKGIIGPYNGERVAWIDDNGEKYRSIYWAGKESWSHFFRNGIPVPVQWHKEVNAAFQKWCKENDHE